MAHESGGSGGGSGAVLPGNPDSLREAAVWLRELAAAAEALERGVRWGTERAEQAWVDRGFDRWHRALFVGGMKVRLFVDQLEDLAGYLDSCADALATAQARFEEGLRIARQMNLEIVDGWILEPPMLGDPSRNELPDYDRPDAVDYYNLQRSHFQQANELIESGSQLILNELETLGDAHAQDWNSVLFIAGNFTYDTTADLIEEFTRRLDGTAQHHRVSGNYWVDVYNKSAGATDLRRHADWYLKDHQHSWARSSFMAEKLGFVGKVLRGGQPVIAIGGVAYDIFINESPPDRAIFSAGIGLGAGAAVGFLVLAAVGGVGGIILAGAVSTWAGSYASDKVAEFYDDAHRPTARELLLDLE